MREDLTKRTVDIPAVFLNYREGYNNNKKYIKSELYFYFIDESS